MIMTKLDLCPDLSFRPIITLTGTYEEAMKEIDKAAISDGFKDHLRVEYHKVYDDAFAGIFETVE